MSGVGAPRLEQALRSIGSSLAAQGLAVERYRRSALLRHIRSRSAGRSVRALESYARRLAEDADEAAELVRALTRPSGLLFSDTAVLAALRRILSQRLASDRCAQLWVPDCGSGTEAYVLAMVVEDLLAQADLRADFIVYGTDADVSALQQARRGRMACDTAAVPQAMRERFLTTDPGVIATPGAANGMSAAWTEFTAGHALRRRCQFMLHRLDTPPPFLDLTLVLCRNHLSYFAPTLQRRVLEHLHRTLQAGGLLLLDTADEPLLHEDLFTPHPQAPGLYLRRERSRPALPRDTGLLSGLDVYAAAFLTDARPQLLLDSAGQIVDANPAVLALFNETSTVTLVGRNAGGLFAAADAQRLQQALARVAAGLGGSMDIALLDGRPLQLALRAVGRAPDRILACLQLPPDASAPQAQLLQQSLQSSRRLDALLASLHQAVVLCDAGSRILDMNARAEQLTGCVRGEALGQLLAQVFRVEPLLPEEPAAPVSMVGSGREYWLTHRDGRRCAVIGSEHRFEDDSRLWVFDDVSQHKLITGELAYRATHDAVTGLFNRETFELHARRAQAAAQQDGTPSVLCYLDVDQFKLINDTLGHGAGDELLRELGAELRGALAPAAILARLGGDEFGVLMPGHELSRARPTVDALLLAARRFRFDWNGTVLAVTLSIGVSLIDAQCGVTHALSLADAACFAAKDAGRDRARFAGEDDALARRHLDMSHVGQLGRALQAGSFELHVDDVVDIAAPQRVVYRELLVRLREHDGRLLAPTAFIQAAERFFMMSALDRWVIRHALRGIAQLPADDVVYAINLSAQSLGDEQFLDYLLGELDDSGVDTRRVCFEITETAAVSRLTEAVQFVRVVSDAGCRFALDDFGVGMASFAYLKNFDVDFLKIDGSFVRSMLENRVDRGVVESINRIGHQMGLRTIAEHVESQALLEPLRAIGVNWAQGRGIAASRPLAELLKHP